MHLGTAWLPDTLMVATRGYWLTSCGLCFHTPKNILEKTLMLNAWEKINSWYLWSMFDSEWNDYTGHYGHNSVKQFIRGKPIRFGYKFWTLWRIPVIGITLTCDMEQVLEKDTLMIFLPGSQVVLQILKVLEIPQSLFFFPQSSHWLWLFGTPPRLDFKLQTPRGKIDWMNVPWNWQRGWKNKQEGHMSVVMTQIIKFSLLNGQIINVLVHNTIQWDHMAKFTDEK